jgi:hypothetical protein
MADPTIGPRPKRLPPKRLVPQGVPILKLHSVQSCQSIPQVFKPCQAFVGDYGKYRGLGGIGSVVSKH